MTEIPIDTLLMPDKRLTSVSFSYDEKIAIGCATDSSGYVYSIDDGKLIDKENPIVLNTGKEEVTALCKVVFHPNKKILGICDLSGITLWSYEDDDEFKLLHTIQLNKTESNPFTTIHSFAFDPSKTNYLAYSTYGKLNGSFKHYIVILDLTSIYDGTQNNKSLRPHSIISNRHFAFDVYNMSFHPSKQILAIGVFKFVILFKIGTVEPIIVFENYEPTINLTSLVFHNNGDFLASGYNT